MDCRTDESDEKVTLHDVINTSMLANNIKFNKRCI